MKLHLWYLLLLCLIVVKAEEVETEEDDIVEVEDTEVETEEEEPAVKDHSNGFGADIDWYGWPDALEVSKKEDKPVFLLIHKSWCGACKRLKESFLSSSKRDQFVKLAKDFVMVNLEDDDEPEDEKYAPDGRYIPRLYFLDREGNPLPIDNKKNYPKNAYYFPVVPDVLKAMKQALKLYHKKGDEAEEKPKTKKQTKKNVKKTDEDKENVKAKKEETKNAKEEAKVGQGNEKAQKSGKNESKKVENNKKKEGEKKNTQSEKSTKETKDSKKSKEPEGECPHAKKAKKEKANKAKKTEL